MDQQIKLEEMEEPHPPAIGLNFDNTEKAFANKSDKELKFTERIFKLMNNNTLVKLGSFFGLWAVKLRLPFADFAVKKTIFPQFCGGENLLDCQSTIDHLYKNDTLTLLDYGAEGKSKEEDLDQVRDEYVKAIEMAASNNSVPGVTVKFTGLVQNEILEVMNDGKSLSISQQTKYDKFIQRVDTICEKAHEHGVGVFVDAEESWIQKPIDNIALDMMGQYNQEKVIIFNTYQMYLHPKLAQYKSDVEKIKAKGCLFGSKLVRGAYMEKENLRAQEKNYPTPVQPNKIATDQDYDAALEYSLDNYESISFVCATHNTNSSMLLAQMIDDKQIDKSHRHINFCQLYGMSDNITFNLAEGGYNVAKYVPYGPVKEVIPYLIRRAQENTSVTGEMGRELGLVKQEIKRRGI